MNTPSEDPTQGALVAEAANDPTLARDAGDGAFDDPTRGRELSAQPDEDPTQGASGGVG